MHLKYESNLIRIMVFIAFLILAIFIGFTFFDVAYR
jgi:cytochrome c oxidase subunit 4